MEALKRRARVLRSAGFSYEDIAAELSSDEVKLPPWTIYSWCNPAKTGRTLERLEPPGEIAGLDRPQSRSGELDD
jgi:hypothetical protein